MISGRFTPLLIKPNTPSLAARAHIAGAEKENHPDHAPLTHTCDVSLADSIRGAKCRAALQNPCRTSAAGLWHA